MTVWEMLTFGEAPYQSMNVAQYLRAVNGNAIIILISHRWPGGFRLLQPPVCSDELYALLEQCWADIPKQRPSFVDIYRSLAMIAENPVKVPDWASNTDPDNLPQAVGQFSEPVDGMSDNPMFHKPARVGGWVDGATVDVPETAIVKSTSTIESNGIAPMLSLRVDPEVESDDETVL